MDEDHIWIDVRKFRDPGGRGCGRWCECGWLSEMFPRLSRGQGHVGLSEAVNYWACLKMYLAWIIIIWGSYLACVVLIRGSYLAAEGF